MSNATDKNKPAVALEELRLAVKREMDDLFKREGSGGILTSVEMSRETFRILEEAGQRYFVSCNNSAELSRLYLKEKSIERKFNVSSYNSYIVIDDGLKKGRAVIRHNYYLRKD